MAWRLDPRGGAHARFALRARSAHRPGARGRGLLAPLATLAPLCWLHGGGERRGGGGEAGGVRPGSLPVSGARSARSAHRQGARARGTARSARSARYAPTGVAAWRGDRRGGGRGAGQGVGLTCRLRQTRAPGGLRRPTLRLLRASQTRSFSLLLPLLGPARPSPLVRPLRQHVATL